MPTSLNTVELLGYYGGDEAHALSAWTSTSRELTTEKQNRIPALLAQLASNGHHTPFEKSSLHFLVRTDIATHIHIIKHRIGVSVNAESARYRELKDDDYIYPTDWPTYEDAQEDPEAQHIFNLYHQTIHTTLHNYHELVESVTDWILKTACFTGVDPKTARNRARKRAKESARFVRPYATQLTSDVQFNFRSFMHFQKLRNDAHAQLEVREVAQKMLRLTQQIPGKPFMHSLNAFGYTSEI